MFRYFPRWSIEDTAKGSQWDLFDIQGKYNVWFTGGGLSWDTTKSCFEYNMLLFNQVQRSRDFTIVNVSITKFLQAEPAGNCAPSPGFYQG